MAAHYNRGQLAQALSDVGLRAGDVVFSHSNVGYFGLPEEGRSPDAVFTTILGAFRDVIGPSGTLVVPTFTYSFCRQQPFDPAATPSTCGMFTELVRSHPDARRSCEPIFSVAAIGGRADELTANVPSECFGPDSFWERFLAADGVICNLNFDAGSTFVHFLERKLGVPYRYNKRFPGTIVEGGVAREAESIYFVQDLSNPATAAVFEPLDALTRQRGIARTARVGRGAVVALRARELEQLVTQELATNPWLLVAQPAPELVAPADTTRFATTLARDASMFDIVGGLWRLPRDLVSDGYDAALAALGAQVELQVNRYATGTRCGAKLIPEKWTCDEAYIETLTGTQVFSYADCPLHVASYSLSCNTEVTREQLLEHLAVHDLASAIPARENHDVRAWTLCCSRDQRDALVDDRYKVVIRTRTAFGMLKVGEVVVPGETDESIVLCTDLAHPAQANRGLSGVAVGIGVVRELLRLPRRRYTVRLIVAPADLGIAAYFTDHRAVFTLKLDALGLARPHVFSPSLKDTRFDRACRSVLERGAEVGEPQELACLSRGAYPERGSHLDSIELVSATQLERSRDLILSFIDAWDRA